jgi:hypothetical protein
MRKITFKLLASVSFAALSMGAAAYAADTNVYQSLPSDDWNEIYQWNELYSEGALGAAVSDATQIASIYAQQIDAMAINAADTLTIDQTYFTDEYTSSLGEDDSDGVLFFGAGNSATANTTKGDALIDGATQVASVAFQTASIDVLGASEDVTTIDITQQIDGYGYPRNDEGFYAFGMMADNQLAATSAFQGTAVIDGLTQDGQGEDINGLQQAVVSMNTIAVTASNSNNDTPFGGNDVEINLNDGQAFDVAGVSSGEEGWDVNSGEDYFASYEAFTLSSTNEAIAYAPHLALNDDPAVKNLDQVAAVAANSISVGAADTNANFTIMDIYDSEDGDYYAGQTANFNANGHGEDSVSGGGNIANFEDFVGAYYAGEDFTSANEINVRNVAVATTSLEVVAHDASGEDMAGLNLGALAGWAQVNDNLGYEYDGHGDVGLENLSQVASVAVNSIANKGTGDLTLKGEDSYTNIVPDDMSFGQSVTDFVFDANAPTAESNYGQNPSGLINTAIAYTDTGDVTVDGVDQTVSFGFNSIRSNGDINGWTALDDGRDSNIFQYSETSIYDSGEGSDTGYEDSLQNILASTDNGDVVAQDLSQTMVLSTNTITANGASIRADLSQDANGYWGIGEPSDLDLYSGDGAVTGGNLSQTASLTANSISTRDILDAEGELVTAGGDLTAEYVDQNAADMQLEVVDYEASTGYNEMDVEAYGGGIDLGQLSQVYFVNLNTVDVAGDISVTDLDQTGTDYNVSAANEIWANADEGGDALLGGDATPEQASVQAAYLNVNSVSAGGAISTGSGEDAIHQQINADYYSAGNHVYAWSASGLAEVANFTQVAEVNLNQVSAGVFDGANIEQNINYGVTVDIENNTTAISDIGTANIEGVTQQAIARVNSISGL